MAGPILLVLVVLFLAPSAIAVLVVLGIGSKSSPARNAARRFHRAVGNPIQMRSAGMPGAYASVLRHRGRNTRMTYETPVVAAPTEDGFVIAIVYGARTDWLKNVLASGTATIVHEGHAYSVDHPQIVSMKSADPYFPAKTRRTHRRFRIERCLRVRRVEVAKASADSTIRAAAPLSSRTDHMKEEGETR